MKYLLHSRKFKSILSKWLFYYVGTIALFTAVVTYSRYISSLSKNDNARAAAFDVNISIVCDHMNGKKCDLGSYRAKKNNSFKFNVDTSKLEVSTLLSINLDLADDFSKPVLSYKDSNGDWIILNNGDLGLDIKPNGNSIAIVETVNSGYTREYKLDCTYDKSLSSGRISGEALKVGYSAAQID